VLATLPEWNTEIASRVVAYRLAHGGSTSLEELAQHLRDLGTEPNQISKLGLLDRRHVQLERETLDYADGGGSLHTQIRGERKVLDLRTHAATIGGQPFVVTVLKDPFDLGTELGVMGELANLEKRRNDMRMIASEAPRVAYPVWVHLGGQWRPGMAVSI